MQNKKCQNLTLGGQGFVFVLKFTKHFKLFNLCYCYPIVRNYEHFEITRFVKLHTVTVNCSCRCYSGDGRTVC